MFEHDVFYEPPHGGKHRLNEEICVIKWCVADLLEVMEHQGIELTDENVDKAIDAVSYLHDRSIELGWEVIEILLEDARFKHRFDNQEL